MKIFNESEIKYLAGLLDADGSLSFKFCKSSSGKTFLYLILSLSASEKIDRHGYIKDLSNKMGSCIKISYDKETYSDANCWRVQDRKSLNMLIPRLTKHMVIKAKHWKRLYDKFCEYRGQDVSNLILDLKDFSFESRKNVGPLKPKNHPTWAWVAGYIDGDGCYTFKKNQKNVGVISHIKDDVGLKLLHKAFGGSLFPPRLEDNTRLWRVNLGVKNRSFAKMFLTKVVRHSRLKKHKIEQLLNFHNQPQRLTEFTSTEEVIV